VATWLTLLILAYKTGVFYEIPEGLREGIKRSDTLGVPGFIQDPFYTIFQFFWLPIIFIMVHAFRMNQKLVKDVMSQELSKINKFNSRIIIPNNLTNIFEQFYKILYSKWQWILSILFCLTTIYINYNIQIDRIHEMTIMYWWDWRINKVIYIIRLLMLGVDMFFAGILFYKWFFSVFFLKKFLAYLSIKPRPYHPDNAGGLSMIGRVCFLFTLPVFIVGIMLSTSVILHIETTYKIINFSAIAMSSIFLLFVFFFPLIEVHKKMKKKKEDWLNLISIDISDVITQLETKLKDTNFNPVSLFDRLEHLKRWTEIIKKMPTWPFNTKTLSHLISTVSIPIIMLVIELIIKVLIVK